VSERQQILVPGIHVADTVTCRSCATLALLLAQFGRLHVNCTGHGEENTQIASVGAGDIMSLLAVGFVAAVKLGIVRTPTQLQAASASRVAANASEFFFLTHPRERSER
jgi:hypothetical protein